MRLLPRPSERNVFTGDVVAFTSPLTVAAAAVAGPGGAAAARLPYGGSSAATAAAAAAGGIGEELGQSTMVRRVAAMPGDELTTGEEEGAESYIIPEVRPTRWLSYSELSVGGRRARGAYCWAERARLRSPELQSDLLHSATCSFASQSSRFRPLLHNWRPLALPPTLHPHPNPQPPTPSHPVQGHCWVLADNESLSPPHVIDSRSFGPLPLSHIVGRCGGRAAAFWGAVELCDMLRQRLHCLTGPFTAAGGQHAVTKPSAHLWLAGGAGSCTLPARRPTTAPWRTARRAWQQMRRSLRRSWMLRRSAEGRSEAAWLPGGPGLPGVVARTEPP